MHKQEDWKNQTRTDSLEATEDDIFHAYRLLLGREPDYEGWQSHCQAIAKQRISPVELARQFMASAEFATRVPVALVESSLAEIPLEGFSLFVRSDDRDIGRHIRATRAYEPHVTTAMHELLRPGHGFVDVGANVGFFTNLAAHLVGPGGSVVAIEPLDKNVQLIYRSLDRNGFSHVNVHACAASDRVGLISVTTDPGTSNGQALTATDSDSRVTFTQTKLLDDLTIGLQRVDLVKLDIEGYELLAWRGFRHGLRRHRPIVLTEFHPYCMRKFVGVDPLDYLGELFSYASTVQVLPQSGRRKICATPAEVMDRWEAANAAVHAEGTVHLDLLVHPK